MFSYHAITSYMRQRPRKRKGVFKLPPEVTHLVFYPLEEKEIEEKTNQEESTYDHEKIQQAVSEVLNHNYKSRAADFYDEADVQSNEEVISSQSENSNSTPRNENDSLSVSNSVTFTYCDESDQTYNIEKKIKKKKDKLSRIEKNKKSTSKIELESHQNESINQRELSEKHKYNNFYEGNTKSKEKEDPFKRGAHYFCTFPKRKPNPVTPDMKRKIGKQREFEGKFNYYAGAYSSDSDYEEGDDFKKHQKRHHKNAELNDYNKYDFNGHFRVKRHYSDENDDPRYYKPYIPETTINPRVVSEKRCKKIIGKKNEKVFKTLPPKEHPEPFNYTNIFLPPKRFEKSIFYPRGILRNLESEDSFLKHPNSPQLDKVKKYNNKLFESNIHFYDYDELNDIIHKKRSRSTTPNHSSSGKSNKENQEIHYDLRNSGYQSHLHYHDKNYDDINPPSQNLNDARRFPDNYLQSIADE